MKIPAPQLDERSPGWFKWLLPVVAVAMLGLTLVFAMPGFQSRYVADDYCFSAAVRNYDFWSAQSYFYQNVSNRYSVLPLINFSEVFGQKVISYTPLVAILLWLAGTAWLITSLARKGNIQQPVWLGLLVSSALVFFTIQMAPNRFQSVYWRSGLLTYLMPLAFISFLVAILMDQTQSNSKHLKKVGGMAGITLLAFITAGFSETSTAVMVVGLALGIVLAGAVKDRDTRNRWLPFLISALAGALIGLLLLYISPANLRRTSVLPDPPGLPTLVSLSCLYAFDFIVDSLKTLPLPTMIGIATAGLLGMALAPAPKQKRAWLVPVIVMGATFALLVAAAAPSVYAESAYPEARAWFVGRWVLNIGLGSLAFWLGRWASELFKVLRTVKIQIACFSLASLLLLGYGARTALHTFQTIPDLVERAQQWDTRNQILMAAPSGRTVSVQALDSWFGLEEMGPDPAMWVNHCAADYYGLQGIQANE
jgi:hypothetical protein